MDQEQKQQILKAAKKYFKEQICANHIKNTEKLKNIKEFNVNPFLHKYLARFAFGDDSPESMAKALIYPRVLGTSITTTFGNQTQYFCNEVLKSFASTTSGIDIEYVDIEDGQRKYCQVKAGPNTINKDDVPVIKDHFKGVMNLARTNGLRVTTADCVVGVLYGEEKDLSGHYKKINEDFPVIVGQDFWYHLTGDKEFYYDLINAFSEVADDIDASQALEDTVARLSTYFKKIQEMNKDSSD